jgi:hypothetical protein
MRELIDTRVTESGETTNVHVADKLMYTGTLDSAKAYIVNHQLLHVAKVSTKHWERTTGEREVILNKLSDGPSDGPMVIEARSYLSSENYSVSRRLCIFPSGLELSMNASGFKLSIPGIEEDLEIAAQSWGEGDLDFTIPDQLQEKGFTELL